MRIQLSFHIPLICAVLATTRASNNEVDSGIKNYLLDSHDFLSEQLKTHAVFTRETTVTVGFHGEQTVTLPGEHGDAHAITMFNRSYLVVDYKLYNVVPDSSQIVKVVQVPSAKLLTFGGEIVFVKTIEYNSLGLMIVGMKNGMASIYGYKDGANEHFFIHSIAIPYNLTDAQFFVNRENLYLIISSIAGSSFAPVSIYKWVRTHFDWITGFSTDGSMALSTFATSESEIIVLLRRSNIHKSYTYPFVYEFNSEHVRKIQILEKIKPKHIINLVQERARYIITIGHDRIILYRWTGLEFVKLQNFEVYNNMEQAVVTYVNQTPLVFLAYKHKLDVYTLHMSKLHLISSYEFQTNYTKILHTQLMSHENKHYVLILGLKDDRIITYSVIILEADKLPIVVPDKEDNQLSECLQELENTIHFDETVVDFAAKRRGEITKESASLELQGNNRTAPVLAQSANIELTVPHDDFEENLARISSEIRDVENSVRNIQPQLSQLLNADITVVFGKLIIQGKLNALQFTSKQMNVKKLNGVEWTPEEWLSYSKEQIISSSASINNMKVDIITVPAPNKYFSDLLLLKGNQQLESPIALQSLKANNVFTPEINKIPVEKMYFRSEHVKVLGNKTFDNINVHHMQVELLNKQNASNTIKLFGDPKAVNYDFASSINVTNLIVESINNINWEEFSRSVFRLGSDSVINGNINISSAKINGLQTNTLSGIEVDNLLTTSTNQTVNSNLTFENLDARNVISEKINGLDFINEVAWVGATGKTIKGPVTIANIEARGNLSLNDSTGEVHKQNHIVGTNATDLLQIYNSRVKITGNLHLQNLYLPGSSKLFVSGNEFNQDNFDEFWLKTINQEIPVHFEALMGITTPHLSTKQLNNVPIDDYMINDFSDKLPTNYVFENATVLGNIFISDQHEHVPNLKELDEASVKLNSTSVVGGVKKFVGKVSVDHLRADFINSVPTVSFQTIYSEQILGNNSFDKIIVQENVVADSINAKTINDISLNDLINRTIFIDNPANLDSADFINITVRNLTTTKINNKLLSDYVKSLDQLLLTTTINLATIEGSARVNNLAGVTHINGINMTDKLLKLQKNGPNNAISEKVNFEGKLHVKNLYFTNMNGIDFRQLLPRLYYRDWMQYISSRHTFKVLTTRNLTTPQINGINIEYLIDSKTTEPQRLSAEQGLQLDEVIFHKSLYTRFLQCDLNKATHSINSLPRRAWNSIVLLGNATVLDEETGLGHLLKYAVHKEQDNVINAHVTLHNVHTENVFTKKHINGVNLHEIVDDALLTSGSKQLVTGYKIFGTLSATSAEVYGNAQIPFVNDVNIVELNSSVIRKSDINNVIVKGRKTFFEGVQATNTFVSTIHGITPEKLVSLVNPTIIPDATFDTLKIFGNLDIGFVNNQNFSEFLSDRLLLESDREQTISAVCFIEELELNGPTSVSNINNVPMDDVVFDENTQIITGFKNIKDLDIVGDVLIENVNGFMIDELHENAVKQGTDVTVEGNLHLNEVSNITGNIVAQTINDVPVVLLKEQLQQQSPDIKANIVRDTIKNIEGLIDESIAILQRLPNQYLYLEKSDKFQTEIPNSVDAQVVHAKENIMIHVKSEEPGDYCGLPSSCVCPNQHTIIITPQYSVNGIENKYGQRVFSYQDDEITIHIVTNSWSSSSDCRTNNSTSLESTTLTWTTTHPVANIPANMYPEPITGYISDVKFFKMEGHVYAILSRFYSPAMDTHDLDCLVVRFSTQMGKVEQLQKIKSRGAWTMHLFYTAQGLHLIIGSKGAATRGPEAEATTNIYRFNLQSQTFQLLRAVPSTGCLTATSIVLGYDSLVILANSKSPMQILKYNRFHDNYHFYQNFIFNHPVISVSVFYTGGAGISDAYLTVVTDNNQFRIYSYQYLSGFSLESDGHIDGLRGLVPFTFLKTPYLFAASINGSSILTIVQ